MKLTRILYALFGCLIFSLIAILGETIPFEGNGILMYTILFVAGMMCLSSAYEKGK